MNWEIAVGTFLFFGPTIGKVGFVCTIAYAALPYMRKVVRDNEK